MSSERFRYPGGINVKATLNALNGEPGSINLFPFLRKDYFTQFIYSLFKRVLITSCTFILFFPFSVSAQSTSRVFWITESGTRIESANLDGSDLVEVVSGIQDARSIAIDPVSQHIYWCNAGADLYKIERTNVNGSGDAEPLPVDFAMCPSTLGDIVIHGRHIYFRGGENEFGLPAFSRSDLDSGNTELLIFGDVGALYGVAGDFFYYSGDGIRKQDLTTGNWVWILQDYEGSLEHIVDDPLTQKMYFQTDFNINRSNYDGSNVEEIYFSSGIENLSIDVLSRRIIWTENGIIRSSALDGSDIRTLGNKDPVHVAVATNDINPPLISNVSAAPLTAQAEQAVTIEATVTDDMSGLNRVLLHYRRGGEPDFQVVRMVATENTYSGFIPASSIGPRGIEYYIEAMDNNDNVSRLPSEQSVELYFPVRVEIESPGLESTLRSGRLQSDYRLISVPLMLENNASSSVLADLGAYDNTRWRFWSLKDNYFNFEGEAQYTELINGANFTPGSAFFMLSTEGGTYRTGTATSITTAHPFTKTLHRGWNFFSSPFTFSLPLEAISLSSGFPVDVQSYAGGWGPTTTLEPFQGYIIDAGTSAEPVVLSIDPDLTAGLVPSGNQYDVAGKNSLAWLIQIDAHDGTYFDHNNMIAGAEEASKAWDIMDKAEPLAFGDYVSVYFPHEEWGLIHKRFETDVRPEPTGGDVWEFEVASGSGRLVTLTFKGLESVPDRYEVLLVDPTLGLRQDVRINPEYKLLTAEKGIGHHLQLLVGESEYVNEQIASLDLDGFELNQNYPNPFRSTTSIRYGISRESIVTIKIHNVLGQVVSRLVDHENRSPGYYMEYWDATTDEGKPLASGLYVYQLHIYSPGSDHPKTVLTQRMLLVK